MKPGNYQAIQAKSDHSVRVVRYKTIARSSPIFSNIQGNSYAGSNEPPAHIVRVAAAKSRGDEYYEVVTKNYMCPNSDTAQVTRQRHSAATHSALIDVTRLPQKSK